PVVLEIAKTAAGRWIEGGEFLFEKGRLSFAVPSPMDVDGVTAIRLDDEPAGLADHRLDTGTGWSFARQAHGFIDALRGEAPVRNPGEEGLADMVLIETIFRKLGR